MQLRPLAILAVAATTLFGRATPVAAQAIAPPNSVFNGQSSSEIGQQQKASAQLIPPVRSFVYVGNYDSNNVSAYRVDAATGALSPVIGSPFATAAGPSSIVARPDGKYLFIANNLASTISTYRIDARGALKEVSSSPFQTDGSPHELAIDQSGRYLYATSKDRDSISVFNIDRSSGTLNAVPGSPFPAGHMPSGIAVGAADKFVYVSHEADDTVTSFAVDATGALTPTTDPAADTGTSPGKIAFSPSARALYVANTGSDSISVFSIGPVRGLLSAVDGSPFSAVPYPGDLLATADGVGLFVGSSQGAGLAGIAIHPSASSIGGTEPLLAPAEPISNSGTLVLASDAAGRFLFAADADTNTVTRYRVDPQTHMLAAGSGLSYATGTSPKAIAVANVAPPTTPALSVSLVSGSLLTFSSTTGTVTLPAPATNGGVSGCDGQVINLAFSIPSIAVISTSTENPATSVCVATGTTSAGFTVTTAANSGSSTLTAFATGYTDGTTNLSVSLRVITLSLPYTNIGTGHTVNGTVTLANPAPTGGVSIQLASNAPQTATVSPTTPIVIAATQTTAPFSVTGVSANPAVITASVAAGGYTSSPLDITVFPPGLTINLPLNAVVAPGQTLPYPISIGAAAAAAVSVAFTTGGGPGTATISPNPVIIPVGATTPATEPTITGGSIGPLTVTGSATGYASDTENATVQITLTFNPNTLSVETGSKGNLTLSASAVAPTGGFTITLSSGNTSFVSVPSPITIPAGSSSVSVPVTGVGPGTTTIQATAPGAITGTATVTDFAPPGITLYGPSGSSNFNLGQNGIVTLSGTIAQAAPAGNLVVNLTTPATSNLLLSNTSTGTGSHHIMVTVMAGSTSIPAFYGQATSNTGTATITATAPNYSNGTATATFTPSGFIVQGGTSTTTLSAASPVYVTFVQLDPSSLAYVSSLTLRPGLAPITVKLTDTNTPAGVGTLSSTSIVFKSGDSQLQTTFQPSATSSGGTAVISFSSIPSPYSQASNDNTTTFTVTAPNSSLGFCNGVGVTGTGPVSLGYNSSCSATAQVAVAAPLGGRKVTLISSSPNVLLSKTATAVGTMGPITLTIPAGSYSAPTFYVQTKASTGSATITESIPGYNSTTATVNFTPSGFILQGGTTTTTFSTASPVYVTFVQLDPNTLAPGISLTLRPGLPGFHVGLTNTDTPPRVGTLGSASIAFASGDSQQQTTFQPSGTNPGTAVIGFGTISGTGYSTPSSETTTTFTVNAPNSSLGFCNGVGVTGTGPVSLGYNSSCSATAQVAIAAPKGGRAVTLTSSNPATLLLSYSATTVGMKSITVNIPAGSYSAPTFYVQTKASTGSATITETIPGYNSTIATVNFTPSGFILQGGTTTTTFSGPSPVYVTFVQLDPNTLASGIALTLRPGVTAFSVGLKDTNTPAGIGTLASSSVSFASGDSQHQTTFQPSGTKPGTAVIGFSKTLPNYSVPSDDATTTFTINAPNSSLGFCNGVGVTGTGSVSLGYNSSCGTTPQLQTAAPSGGRTVTLTSSDATKLLLSKSATAVGAASITVPIAAGGYSGATFYVQSLVSTGSATITETVAGYNPTAATVNFTPSGFILQGGTTTTTYSLASPVYVTFAQLDPVTLASGIALTLRPGLTTINVGLTDTNTPAGVGTLGSTSIAFNSGDSQHQTTFQPMAVGTAVIGFSGTPAGGYQAPSNETTTTFTVNLPNSSVGFCNGVGVTGTGSVSLGYNSSCAATAQVSVAPPTASTVTLTSNSPNLLLSKTATAVGTMGPITVTIPAAGYSAPQFYVQVAASSGTPATITENIPGYNPTTVTVNFTPSGFILQGGTTTTTLSAASSVYVTFVQLDPTTLAPGIALTLRPGLTTFNVGLTDTNTPANVGTLGSNSISFASGDSQHQTTFQPNSSGSGGTAVIGFGTNSGVGYSTPSNDATTTFTVTAPGTSVQAVTIGNYMQATTSGSLAVQAPTGGVTVTVSAPSGILLSTSASAVGKTSLPFTLSAGQSSTPTFYVQSQGGGAGTVNLTISAPGYTNGTGVVTVYPSGFALQGSNFTTTVGDNPTTLTIVPAALDPTYLNIYQVQELVPNVQTLLAALAPPSTATGTLVFTYQSGTNPVGMFSLNSVTFIGDDNPNFLTSSFVPENAGTGLITITSSPGFTNASTEITATVNQ